MARKIKWTASAQLDLEKIVAFIYDDSPIYALAFYEKVKETARNLDEFSNRGRVVPEYEVSTIREVIMQRYRLIYQVIGDEVIILTLIHGARNLK